MYKTFKQYLIEASNLSTQDKHKIFNMVASCASDTFRDDIIAWLYNNVYMWIINKCNHANSDFFTKEEIINIKGQKDIRDVFDDINGQLQNRINNVIKYLNDTYTVEQASLKYGNNFSRLNFLDAEKEYKKASHNIKEIEGTDYEVIKKYNGGYKMVSLLSQKSLNREGNCMGHCTNDETQGYLKTIQNKSMRVLSLRDEYNRPHATLHHNVIFNAILQIKGNGNGPVVSKYIPYIIDFLNDNNFSDIMDLKNINRIELNNKLFEWDNIPSDLIITTNIRLRNKQLTKLPQFPEKIYTNFDCSENPQLTSLKGAPQYVEGNFYCTRSGLVSLDGAPQHIDGEFNCSYNKKLISLTGCPQYVKRDFRCIDVGKKFTQEEIRKVCKVHGKVYV